MTNVLIKLPDKQIKVKLLDSQAELLKLFLTKKEISFEDVSNIWIRYFANKVIDGVPYRWTSDWEKERKKDDKSFLVVGSFTKMEFSELKNRTFTWLKGCIGALVFKGYLKVVPNFNFSE